MMIKYQELAASLKKKIHAIYILIGQDCFLLNDAAYQIKQAWKQKGESDTSILHLNAPAEWPLMLEEANNYSLFHELVLLDVRWDKKNIDSLGKNIIERYLQSINSRCLIILRAANVPAKSLQWLAKHEQTQIVQASPLTASALQNWITLQLKSHAIKHDPQIAALIHQYTQGNMLASAQVIEKIKLMANSDETLTLEMVKEHLIDQCEYQLYELADACLTSNSIKALHILRLAKGNRTEPTLILWLLAQEIRHLIQLHQLIKEPMPFATACSKLKIWPSRSKLYQSAIKNMSLNQLYQLLHLSQQIDEQIKTNKVIYAEQALERLTLALCGQARLS